LHGFVSVIAEQTGKVIDRIHMCSACPECKKHMQDDQSSVEYME
jgi:hypothetical protein